MCKIISYQYSKVSANGKGKTKKVRVIDTKIFMLGKHIWIRQLNLMDAKCFIYCTKITVLGEDKVCQSLMPVLFKFIN